MHLLSEDSLRKRRGISGESTRNRRVRRFTRMRLNIQQCSHVSNDIDWIYNFVNRNRFSELGRLLVTPAQRHELYLDKKHEQTQILRNSSFRAPYDLEKADRRPQSRSAFKFHCTASSKCECRGLWRRIQRSFFNRTLAKRAFFRVPAGFGFERAQIHGDICGCSMPGACIRIAPQLQS